jgi:hypothetical protein
LGVCVDGEPLASIRFHGEVIHWRGPAPYLFVPVPEEHAGEIRYAAKLASYGWGVVPVEAQIGGVAFTTSLFPKDGTYLLPIKVAVQEAAGLSVGDRVDVSLRVSATKLPK